MHDFMYSFYVAAGTAQEKHMPHFTISKPQSSQEQHLVSDDSRSIFGEIWAAQARIQQVQAVLNYQIADIPPASKALAQISQQVSA